MLQDPVIALALTLVNPDKTFTRNTKLCNAPKLAQKLKVHTGLDYVTMAC